MVIYSMFIIAFFYLLVCIYLPLIIYPCPCHLLVNELLNLIRCLALLIVLILLARQEQFGGSHLPFTLDRTGSVGFLRGW